MSSCATLGFSLEVPCTVACPNVVQGSAVHLVQSDVRSHVRMCVLHSVLPTMQFTSHRMTACSSGCESLLGKLCWGVCALPTAQAGAQHCVHEWGADGAVQERLRSTVWRCLREPCPARGCTRSVALCPTSTIAGLMASWVEHRVLQASFHTCGAHSVVHSAAHDPCGTMLGTLFCRHCAYPFTY